MSHTRHTPGTHLAHTRHTPGTHMSHTRHTSGTHLAHTRHTPGTHLAHTWHTPVTTVTVYNKDMICLTLAVVHLIYLTWLPIPNMPYMAAVIIMPSSGRCTYNTVNIGHMIGITYDMINASCSSK
jgi:hypothetical protein